MKSIGIVTDSHSGITPQVAEELGIIVAPMPFFVGDNCLYENVDLSREKFFDHLRSGAKVSTSQPSPGEVTEVWDRALEQFEQILYIPISSGLSSAYATAVMLAEDDYQDRVFVVDAGRVSTAMHQTVLDGLELIERGYSAPEIKQILESLRDKFVIYVAVDDLVYLKRGGRVSASTALLGSMLNIKPILQFDVGPLSAVKKCRGMKKARPQMIELLKADLETRFKEYYDAGEIRILAASSAAPEVTRSWVDQMELAFPGYDVLCDDLSLAVSCHIGPDGLGLCVSCRPKELWT